MGILNQVYRCVKKKGDFEWNFGTEAGMWAKGWKKENTKGAADLKNQT